MLQRQGFCLSAMALSLAQVLVVTSLTEPQARQIQVVVVVADQVEPVLAV